MLEGLYSAAAGMAAQQQRMDAVSNDVANVSTAGYKRTRLSFRDLAYAEQPNAPGVRAGAGSAVTEMSRSERAGAIQVTDQPLDLAIKGEGYLPVRRLDGSLGLTRQGALRIDGDRRLTTANGDLVEPPMTLPQGVSPDQVSVAPDGTVVAQGRTVGRIVLRDVPAPQGLLPTGGGVFLATQASGAVRNAAGSTFQQGALEQSNVDMGEAMVELLEAQRGFSMASKVIQTQDQLMEIANGVKR